MSKLPLDEMLDVLKEVPETPSERLRLRYHAWLVSQERRLRMPVWLQAAAGAAAVVSLAAVVGWGSLAAREAEGLRHDLALLRTHLAVALLSHPEAAERLRAITLSRASDDDALLAALLATVRLDPSVSVRLAVVDRLAGRRQEPEVQSTLLSSLMEDDSPLVQLTLLDLLQADEGALTRDHLSRLRSATQLDAVVRQRVDQMLNERSL